MKVFRVIAMWMAVAAVAAGVPSCVPTPIDPPTPTQSGLSTQLQNNGAAEFDQQKVELTILARLSWTLTVDADWITPSQTRGSVSTNGVVVDLVLQKNHDKAARKGTVTLKTSEATPYTFVITQNPENALTGVNQWIYGEMGKFYYWNEAVKATPAPLNSLRYDVFLSSLIDKLPWADVQDTSSGENPPTIDGHWNKAANGQAANTLRTSIYSYIEKVGGATRAGEATEQTYGMGLLPITIGLKTEGRTRYVFIVSWVRPGGPADKAGIKRGTWVLRCDNKEITESSWADIYTRVMNGTGPTVDISTGEGTVEDVARSEGTELTLTAAAMPRQPIVLSRTLTSPGGRKVAYLAYNQFVIDADMASWTERGDRFLTEMREAFVSFKAAGATEMVLDLRYNPGGYVKACQVLSRLISGAGKNEVFAKMLHNNNSAEWAAYGIRTNPEVWNFSDEASDADALGLRKLYVLATGQSASASEMVINALRGIDVEVVVIGETTNGKNVGMNRFELTDASGTYHLWPITFKVLNAKGFCDYAGGFTPDIEINELAGVGERRPLFSLGDGQEELLRAALTHIDGGQPAVQTRSAASGLRQLPVPASTRGGARIIHAGPTPAPSTNR